MSFLFQQRCEHAGQWSHATARSAPSLNALAVNMNSALNDDQAERLIVSCTILNAD